MVHSSYNDVYRNELRPFAADDSKTSGEYMRIFSRFETALKSVYHRTSEFSECRSEIALLKHPIEQYSYKIRGAEAIAYYVQEAYDKPGNKCIDKIFPGFKEFIQEHTIPDFIKFIEQHPYCNEVTYSDESIHCQVTDGNVATADEL